MTYSNSGLSELVDDGDADDDDSTEVKEESFDFPLGSFGFSSEAMVRGGI